MLALLLSYLLIYKYAVLFVVIATASLGLPIPATTLLMAAGAFAAQGYMDPLGILAYGLLASVLGDGTGYFIALRYGRGILARVGFQSLLASSKFTAIETLFARRSTAVIFSSRFLATSLGPVVNILSGIAKIPYRKFLWYDFLGEFLYIVLFGGLGYAFGNQWEAISAISEDIITILVLIAILVVLFAVVRRVRNGNGENLVPDDHSRDFRS